MQARNRADNKKHTKMKKDKILRLNEDIAAYEDKLRNNGTNLPSSPDIIGSTNGLDQKLSTTKDRKHYKPPREELKNMTKEDLSKWRKEKSQERDRARKRVQRLQQKQLICHLEERVSILKDLYDQSQKPAMPGDFQDKMLDPSKENMENDESNSDHEIFNDDWEFNDEWVEKMIAEAPVTETLLGEFD